MCVRVLRQRSVPPGVVTIEDRYDGREITEIVIRFHPKDLKRAFVRELSKAISKQARQWVERGAHPNAITGPIQVTVERRSDLPGDLRVVIEDDASHVLYIFAEEVITEAGADAFRRMLTGRTVTWVRWDVAASSRR